MTPKRYMLALGADATSVVNPSIRKESAVISVNKARCFSKSLPGARHERQDLKSTHSRYKVKASSPIAPVPIRNHMNEFSVTLDPNSRIERNCRSITPQPSPKTL